MQEMKFCQYCGNNKLDIEVTLVRESGKKYRVHCRQCGAYGPLAKNNELAILKWNSRIQEVPEIPQEDNNILYREKPDFSMDKIIHEVEARIAKGNAQKAAATNPSHYSRWQIEPLDFISANNLDFLRGNIIKYIMRYDAKGGLDDLKKARVYLDRLIEKATKAEND